MLRRHHPSDASREGEQPVIGALFCLFLLFLVELLADTFRPRIKAPAPSSQKSSDSSVGRDAKR